MMVGREAKLTRIPVRGRGDDGAREAVRGAPRLMILIATEACSVVVLLAGE
jgi:hypothetical protein